jgi:hypothetical protein
MSPLSKNTHNTSPLNLKQIRNELNNSNISRVSNKNTNIARNKSNNSRNNSPDKMISQIIKVKARIKPIQHPYSFL